MCNQWRFTCQKSMDLSISGSIESICVITWGVIGELKMMAMSVVPRG